MAYALTTQVRDYRGHTTIVSLDARQKIGLV